MIHYGNEVKKAVKKGTLPKEIFTRLNLVELYENVLDLNTIARFEEKEKKKKVSFSTADDILKN